MRKLNVDDVFELIKLTEIFDVNKLYKEVDKKWKNKPLNDSQKSDYGMDIFLILIRQATTKEKKEAIFEFISRPFECSSEEIGKMNAIDMARGILEIATVSEWRDFFMQVRGIV